MRALILPENTRETTRPTAGKDMGVLLASLFSFWSGNGAEGKTVIDDAGLPSLEKGADELVSVEGEAESTPKIRTIRLVSRRASPCPWCRGARCVKWGTILLPIAWACTYYAYLKLHDLKHKIREDIRKDFRDEKCQEAHNLTMRWQYLYYRLMREETPWKFEQEVEMRPEIIGIMAEGDAT